MKPVRSLIDWLDSRTGIRAGRRRLLEEPLPAGVGWWFVTGSVLLMLLSVQLVTGVALTFYYVPSPAFAYDSVRYVMERVAFGHLLRGLHFFGASFIVVAAVIHMLRVVALGSYKKPREMTWITGVTLLLIVLGFALSGYLLPWDQKAYWATTVTINIARSGPFGEFIAGVLKGGQTLGSLTLLRWYAAHVFLLPGALMIFVIAHLYLMRRHGISGALKYFPGPLEPLATMVIPDLVVGLLFFLPFLDSHVDRHPMKRPLVTGGFGIIGLGIIVLTYLGYQDTPAHADPARWTPLAIAGKAISTDQRCTGCHRPGGAANPILETTIRRDQEWLLSHVRDPEAVSYTHLRAHETP